MQKFGIFECFRYAKAVIFVCAVAVLAGCGHGGSGKAADSTAVVADSAAQGAAARLEAIYADVFGWYAKAEKDLSVAKKMPDFDAEYMSSAYNDVLRKVKDIDKKAEANGEIGFFDYDHWVMGQDYQGLKMVVVNVRPTGQGKCSADVDITNCGTTQRIAVALVLENGQWMIDDFVRDGQSEKSQMLEYVKK